MGPVVQALVEQAKSAEQPEFQARQKIFSMRNAAEGPLPAGTRDSNDSSRERLTSEHSGDVARLSAARTGNAARVAEFIRDISSAVWKSCCVLAGNGNETREAFSEVMAALSANRFARLASYTGRSSIHTFVALVTRDLIAERVLRLMQSEPEQGWMAFERLFQADIQRVIRKRFPHSSAEETRRDLYQDVCLAFIDNDYRRIRTYSGNGSFAGFVLRSVDHLMIDALRENLPRRRLPAEVAKLPALEQEIFKLLHWQGVIGRPDVLTPHFKGAHDVTEIAMALSRVRQFPAPVNGEVASLSISETGDLVAPDERSPEAEILRAEEDRRLDAALEILSDVAARLSGSERLYLSIVLSAA